MLRPPRVRFHGTAVGLLLGGAFWPCVAATQLTEVPPGQVQLAAPALPAKTGTAVYLVQLRQPGVASYKGGVAGYPATKPAAGRRLDARSGAASSYAGYLEQTHDRLLSEVGAPGAKIYSYRYALNGFAARLTPAQAARIAQHPSVERVTVDRTQTPRTNNSAIFLGLEDLDGGLRAEHALRGEDIVIAVVDSGVAPEHPALADAEERIPRACNGQWARSSWLGMWLCHAVRRRPPTVRVYDDPPERFQGVCQEGERFEASACNNKLVGARYYVDGFLASHDLDAGEFLSPRDADGHGTHVATTAAGNAVTARLFGARIGRVAGIAPRARIAVYKACWLEPGATRASCATSDLTRAVDDAVADGVDLINFSVGSTEADLTRPDDLALLAALDAGVLSVVAAGNDGPELGTITSPSGAPWVLTVAASTQSGTRFEEAIEITAPLDLAGRIVMREASFTPPLRDNGSVEGRLVLADDGQDMLVGGGAGSTRDACEPLANGGDMPGQLALIERGGCDFQDKIARAQAAGAIGVLVYNNVGAPIVMNGDRESVGIPAVMIGLEDGQRLVNRLAAGTEVRVRVGKGILLERDDAAYRLGEFSSRGPAISEPDFLKPDLTAPGVNILAGHTPDVANGLRGESFQYQTGTSMAAPEVIGIAALLKQRNPDWSPAVLKSALMTTAQQSVTRADGANVHPFDVGAGHLDANRALDPGLVYDAAHDDHAAYLCGLHRPPFPAAECEALAHAGYSSQARQLNLPSIGITELVSGDVVRRRVTNVGPAGTYSAQVQTPAGFEVAVDPPTLHLATGQSAEFTLTFHVSGAPRDLWSFGRLRWSDGTRSVTSPMALRPVTLRAPAEVYYAGTAGTASLPIAFGYTGEYFAGVHGLRAALVMEGFVDQDPTRNFDFRFGNGVSAHFVEIPVDQLYARFVLRDELTDGADDLDLYLFHCPQSQCRQVAQSGAFTSDEQIDLLLPEPGVYVALVHGFETDPLGGPGANYFLLGWSLGFDDDLGNLEVLAPEAVVMGQRTDAELSWGGLAAGAIHLGIVSHDTPEGLHSLTIVNVDTR